MLRFAGEFGLTPVARSRLAAGIGGKPPAGGKFDGLLHALISAWRSSEIGLIRDRLGADADRPDVAGA
jgi:hypothetical protein